MTIKNKSIFEQNQKTGKRVVKIDFTQTGRRAGEKKTTLKSQNLKRKKRQDTAEKRKLAEEIENTSRQWSCSGRH